MAHTVHSRVLSPTDWTLVLISKYLVPAPAEALGSVSDRKSPQESSKDLSLCVFVVRRAGRERCRLNSCAKGLPPKAFLVLLVLTDLGIPTSHIHALHGTPAFQYRAMNHTADSVSHFLPGTSSKALEPGL